MSNARLMSQNLSKKGDINVNASIRLCNSDKAVPAKYLEINGEVIRDPSGNPYLVPADFDWKTYMEKFEKFRDSLEAREKTEPTLPDEGTSYLKDAGEVYGFLYTQFHAAWPASPSDIQRTYNGYTGKDDADFVPAFRPAASFLLRRRMCCFRSR